MPVLATAPAKTADPLRVLVDRRHPKYYEARDHWDFLEATYEGGPTWFFQNIFKYVKEGDTEFADRVARAYRFNHTREVVDLVTKYIYKADIVRKDDTPEPVKKFWKSATKNGQPIDTFMRMLSTKSSMTGIGWVVVDSTRKVVPETVEEQKKQEKEEAARTYAYYVRPQDVLDMSFDDMGRLNWVLVREFARDDADPMNSTGEQLIRFRLWDRVKWVLYEERIVEDGGSEPKVEVVQIGAGAHDLGVVPLVKAPHIEVTDEPYTAPSLVGDIAYLDRAVANYLSNLDAIIQDQTFSQLVIPAQGLLGASAGTGGTTKDDLMEAGTRRIFVYDGEANKAPEFISPDVKQANLIISTISKIINEIYHSVGMAGERTKEDNSVGIDNSSGVAKAYDFDRMDTLLTTKADALEHVEREVNRLVMLWEGGSTDGAEDWVQYPETFDTRGLADELDIANQLTLAQAPDMIRRKQMGDVSRKLFPGASEADKAKIEKELETWPPKPEPMEAVSGLTGKPRPKDNRQGEVTSKTPAKAA